MDFILGINKRIIFKQTNKRSPRGIVAIKKILQTNEFVRNLSFGYTMKSPIVFPLAVFFFFLQWRVEGDYILAAANTNWQSDMSYNNRQKDRYNTDAPEPRRQIWSGVSLEAMQIRAKVIHVQGLTLPEMFLSFNESWYQPPRNASSPANLALNCKTNIKTGAGEGSF